MRFVPIEYEQVEEFEEGRWYENGEGITALNHLDELVLGDDVIVGIEVRGHGLRAVVRGTVVWRRGCGDARAGLRPGAGVRVDPNDAARLEQVAWRETDARAG